MADATTGKKFWSFISREFFAEMAGALALDVLFKHLKEKGAERAAQAVTDKVFNDKRAELLEDFRIMATEDTKPGKEREGKNIDNLTRRHRVSKKKCTENKFVDLLCKIERDETLGRRPTLWWLNDLDDETFDQMLYLLDNDVILQWIQWTCLNGGEITQKQIANLKAKASAVADATAKVAPKVLARLDQAATQAAPTLGGIADWLEEHGGR